METGQTHTSHQVFATEDYLGMAGLYLTRQHYAMLEAAAKEGKFPASWLGSLVTQERLNIDLLITDIGFTYEDHSQVTAYLGDVFGMQFFGKAPMILRASGLLYQTTNNQAKYVMTRLYTDLLRISSVARMRSAPMLQFVGCHAQGAFLNLNIEEAAESQDTLKIDFEFLVINLYHFNTDNTGPVQKSSILYNKQSEVDIATGSEIRVLGALEDEPPITYDDEPLPPLDAPPPEEPPAVWPEPANTETVPSVDPTSYDLDRIITEGSGTHGVPRELIRAVVQAESAANPNATSKVWKVNKETGIKERVPGAQGLMQLMPATAQELGVKDPYNPRDNVMGGSKYLKQLLKRYNGDEAKALAAYNWGMGNVDKHLKAHGGVLVLRDLPEETRNYVPKVLNFKKQYAGKYAAKDSGKYTTSS